MTAFLLSFLKPRAKLDFFKSIFAQNSKFSIFCKIRGKLWNWQKLVNFIKFKKIELTVNIKNITFRFLEENKFDCLVEDISVKNEETKDYLLRIP